MMLLLVVICWLVPLTTGATLSTGVGMAQNNLLFGIGTVRFNPLEGGFFQIEADNGKIYTPTELPTQYRRDGLRVRFAGQLRSDAMSIYMSGEILELSRVEHE